ncbi:hypothetical protein, partial [Sedimentisphaera salicampi]|uniref:hypothetical protein n=1 Tax=Sedimentisphaera salicampi TaxID=1941349 RepID=UPI00195E2BFA
RQCGKNVHSSVGETPTPPTSNCGKNFQGSVGKTFTAAWEKFPHPQRLTVGKTSQRCGKNVHKSVGEIPT